MKQYLLLLVLFSFTIPVYCQQITFQKTYGGINNDFGNSVQQTADGGYIIAGITFNFGAGTQDMDVYLIKTDPDGNALWEKTFGGTNGDGGSDVLQTTDGGYIIAGNTWSFGAGIMDIYLIKTDSFGNMLWTKTFGRTGDDEGISILQTTDGGYVISGNTIGFSANYDDAYLMKTDANGNLIWTKTIDEGYENTGESFAQTSDGGYIITGTTTSIGGLDLDMYIVKTDSAGNSLWEKAFGGINDDFGGSVQQTNDGGYIIAGSTFSFGAGYYDSYLVKTDSNGNLLWSKLFGGTASENSNSVHQTTDGGYIIGGNTFSFGTGGRDVYLIKTDANGDSLWTKTYGGINDEYSVSVKQTADGGYIITGHTYSFGAGYGDVYLIKTDSLGNSGCSEGSTATIVDTVSAQLTDPATSVSSPSFIETVPNTTVDSGGVVITLCTSVGINEIKKDNSFLIYPNPSMGNFIISFERTIIKGTVEILNTLGEKVFEQELSSNNTSAELNLSFLQQGVYFLNVKSNGENWTKKIVKM